MAQIIKKMSVEFTDGRTMIIDSKIYDSKMTSEVIAIAEGVSGKNVLGTQIDISITAGEVENK